MANGIALVGLISASVALVPPAHAEKIQTSCSVINTEGVQSSLNMALDISGNNARVGFQTVGQSNLELPDNAMLMKASSGLYEFRAAKGVKIYKFQVSTLTDASLEIGFSPLSGANAKSGFVGFCKPSKSVHVESLPSIKVTIPVNDGQPLGWTRFVKDISLKCKFISRDLTAESGSILISPGVGDGAKGGMVLKVGSRTLESTYILPAVDIEGDHKVLTALFSASKSNEKFIGAFRVRCPIIWLYVNPGSGIPDLTNQQALCSE